MELGIYFIGTKDKFGHRRNKKTKYLENEKMRNLKLCTRHIKFVM
jgi:hypothetical protein